jgi:hypothetical protein
MPGNPLESKYFDSLKSSVNMRSEFFARHFTNHTTVANFISVAVEKQDRRRTVDANWVFLPGKVCRSKIEK